jgi:hypothetical protein
MQNDAIVLTSSCGKEVNDCRGSRDNDHRAYRLGERVIPGKPCFSFDSPQKLNI